MSFAPSKGFVSRYAQPVRVVSSAPPVIVQSRPANVSPQVAIQTKGDYRTYYDPSRVVDVDAIKLVKDLRDSADSKPSESAEERGDTQTGDNGRTGPGSTSGTFATPRIEPGVTKSQSGLTPAQLALIALGSFLLFGG